MNSASTPPPADPNLRPPLADPSSGSTSRLPLLVIVAGLFTTALTLAIVWLISANSEANVMGWYANYVIPVGALLVGLGAAAGYGLASWITGVKIRRGLLVTILLLQLAAYFAAQYIEFRMLGPLVHTDTGTPVGFFEYFHINAVSFAWVDKKTNAPGEPLGMWGYLFRLLEVAGFALGGLIVPLALMKAAYCDSCQRYKKTRRLAVIPASASKKQIKKGLATTEAEAEKGQQQFQQLRSAAQTGDHAAFGQQVTAFKADAKAADKLPSRVHVSLIYCKCCCGGTLKSEMLSGQGNQIKRAPLDTLELHPDFVRQIQTT